MIVAGKKRFPTTPWPSVEPVADRVSVAASAMRMPALEANIGVPQRRVAGIGSTMRGVSTPQIVRRPIGLAGLTRSSAGHGHPPFRGDEGRRQSGWAARRLLRLRQTQPARSLPAPGWFGPDWNATDNRPQNGGLAAGTGFELGWGTGWLASAETHRAWALSRPASSASMFDGTRSAGECSAEGR